MSTIVISILLSVAADISDPSAPGVIEGVVVNASQQNAPVPDAEVVLQLQLDGQFTPVEKKTADDQGRFRFENLPVGLDFLYLPGANRDGIHYPGRRIELTSRRTNGYLEIPVRDTISDPSPLIIRELEIVLRPDAGALHVVEGMLVENPTQSTYVGAQAPDKMNPTTLSLGITPEFQRLTFDEEFYGRQFVVHDQQVVTSLPWTPGQRLLRYTYTIPNEQASRDWRHAIELPCERIRVRVLDGVRDEIVCNLPLVDAESSEENGVVYEQRDLLAGDEVVLMFGRLPILWTTYARWGALAVLVALISTAVLLLRRSGRGRITGDDKVRAASARETIPLSDHERRQARKKRRRRTA